MANIDLDNLEHLSSSQAGIVEDVDLAFKTKNCADESASLLVSSENLSNDKNLLLVDVSQEPQNMATKKSKVEPEDEATSPLPFRPYEPYP